MDSYLAAPVVDSKADVLEWREHHSKVYPCLARIARVYLILLFSQPVFQPRLCSRAVPT